MTHYQAKLEQDLERLVGALREATTALDSTDELERMKMLLGDATAVRNEAAPRAALAARIAELNVARLSTTARYFTDWCHLMNLAEEQQRLHTLRSRVESADGVAATTAHMAATGVSADDVRALLARSLVMPVLTAHPSEARRRSILDHLDAVAAELDAPEVADHLSQVAAHRRLHDAVFALYSTEESRASKPTVLDEIDASLEVFRRTLFDATPALYSRLELALEEAYPGEEFKVPSFLRFGTWVGGDRDGNPNVTAASTRSAFERQRAAVLARYLLDVRELSSVLSTSARRAAQVTALAPLHEDLARERIAFPEVAARAEAYLVFEPWREKLWYVAARLRATAARTEIGYLDASGYQHDLALLADALCAAGYESLARGKLAECRRRADVFGFHLATLDIRQHSKIHERVVDELLTQLGCPGYTGLDEAARTNCLENLLSKSLPALRDRTELSAVARDLLSTLDVLGRARRDLGPRACERYIVSFASTVSDLLEVVLLSRLAGLAPGELRPVPLLEQLGDLRNAGTLATAVLDSPVLRAEIGDELEVMLGYSDSGKEVGYVVAAVALRDAQRALARATEKAGVMLTVFHGRGGAIGRGGGPAGESIRAQPPTALRGRIRVTEQGETITARYARAEIAVRDLELTVSAVLGASTGSANARDRADEPGLERGVAAALAAYQQLTSDKQRLAAYAVAATPIEQVMHLPLGSRPSSRAASADAPGGLSLDELRAIPWVFSWNQSRHGLPGWYGVGSALEAMFEATSVDDVRAALDTSPFLRVLVRNAEMSLVRADLGIAEQYAALAPASVSGLFTVIADEHERTTRALRTLRGADALLPDRPHIAESVTRRNPTIDILSHLQIEALRRLRSGVSPAENAALAEVASITIGGIAAGLQTVG